MDLPRQPMRRQLRKGKMAFQDIQALVHEMQGHQIELEMQNEELRRGKLELAEAFERYSDLLARCFHQRQETSVRAKSENEED
jgi:hypothetical protein